MTPECLFCINKKVKCIIILKCENCFYKKQAAKCTVMQLDNNLFIQLLFKFRYPGLIIFNPPSQKCWLKEDNVQ